MSVDYDCSESINMTGATIAIIVSSISSYMVNYSDITTSTHSLDYTDVNDRL